MDDLEFLADDHKFLNLQIIRFMGLLKAFDDGQLGKAGLHIEIRRQTVILHSELVEHFAYEEVTAFPHLEERFPEFGPRLQTMLTQHADIIGAFEEFRSVLNEDPPSENHAKLLAEGTIIKTAFEQHTVQETQLLGELLLLTIADSDSD